MGNEMFHASLIKMFRWIDSLPFEISTAFCNRKKRLRVQFEPGFCTNIYTKLYIHNISVKIPPRDELGINCKAAGIFASYSHVVWYKFNLNNHHHIWNYKTFLWRFFHILKSGYFLCSNYYYDICLDEKQITILWKVVMRTKSKDW